MKRFVMLVVVSLCVCMSYASWQNPVLLTELNDFDSGAIAHRPSITGDGNTIYFTRNMPPKVDPVWEARRNPDTGVFDFQRQLGELKNGGANVYGIWLSPDKLRLYYATPDPQAFGYVLRPIWLAIRNNPEAQWQTIKRLTELEIEPHQSNCSLTADEKLIMWESSTIKEGGPKRIFTAGRPSILHSFADIREMTELEAVQAENPRMSGNGLVVYFQKIGPQGKYEAWVGYRKSLDLPFGDLRPMQDINSQGVLATVCPSLDGRELYYFQRQGEIGDLNTCGIFVSQWVDDSFEDAVANMNRAINKKERAAELLQGAAQDEQIAYNLLKTLPQEAFPAQLAAKDINAAVKRLEHAMAKQNQIASILGLCLDNLRLSVGLLLPPIPTVQ